MVLFTGDQGMLWKQAYIDISADIISVNFQAVIGKYKRDIAIDDVYLHAGSCSNS